MVDPGTMVFAGIGALIVGALGFYTRGVRLQWLETMLVDMDERINEVSVYVLTKEEKHELLHTRRGDTLDAEGVLMAITETAKQPSTLVRFTMYSDDGRVVQWYQGTTTGEFIMNHFRIGGSYERAIALKYKDRLKAVGNEAYVMWKMSQP